MSSCSARHDFVMQFIDIARNGIPFSLTLPVQPKSLEEMSKSELDAKIEHSYNQALARQGKPMNEVFEEIERKHED